MTWPLPLSIFYIVIIKGITNGNLLIEFKEPTLLLYIYIYKVKALSLSPFQ